MKIRNWSSFLFPGIPIALSLFTFLWNPIGFPSLQYGEGTYIGRGMHILLGQGLQDPEIYYNHPYFGMIFLAGVFWVIGYPISLHPSAYGDVVQSVEMLWLVPRVLMGVLAVIDTFLIYKISERWYNNRVVALIASVLFAVLPTWFLRRPYLDTILLPFLLSSILFAIIYRKDYHSEDKTRNSNKTCEKKNIFSLLASGIFLGLAIFTKIPAFTMIPLIGFLIFTNHNKRWIYLGLWFIPVVFIPLIWPAYAILVGEFDKWLNGFLFQAEHGGRPLLAEIITLFYQGPILVILGMAGIAYAALRRDLFLLLWIGPYLLFLYLIDFARDYFFILIFPTLCIASARLIVGLSNKFRNKNIQQILPFAIISAIGIFGLTSTIMLFTTDVSSNKIDAVAYIAHYLQHYNDKYKAADKNSNDNNKISVISSNLYSWIPQYVFHLANIDYLEPYDTLPVKPQNFLLVLDSSLKGPMSQNDENGKLLKNIYNSMRRNQTYSIIGEGLQIMLPKLLPEVEPHDQTINLINQNHIWKAWNYTKILENVSNLAITVKTNNTNKTSNSAILQTQINMTGSPLILTLDYVSESHKKKATFYAEIKEKDSGHKTLWIHPLKRTSGNLIKEKFFVPSDLVNRPVEFRFIIVTNGSGEHALTVKKATVGFE